MSQSSSMRFSVRECVCIWVSHKGKKTEEKRRERTFVLYLWSGPLQAGRQNITHLLHTPSAVSFQSVCVCQRVCIHIYVCICNFSVLFVLSACKCGMRMYTCVCVCVCAFSAWMCKRLPGEERASPSSSVLTSSLSARSLHLPPTTCSLRVMKVTHVGVIENELARICACVCVSAGVCTCSLQ